MLEFRHWEDRENVDEQCLLIAYAKTKRVLFIFRIDLDLNLVAIVFKEIINLKRKVFYCLVLFKQSVFCGVKIFVGQNVAEIAWIWFEIALFCPSDTRLIFEFLENFIFSRELNHFVLLDLRFSLFKVPLYCLIFVWFCILVVNFQTEFRVSKRNKPL